MASSALVLLYTLCVLCYTYSLQTLAMASSQSCRGLHLQYYTHEIRGGPNNTILLAAGTNQGGSFSDGRWGSFFVFDNMIKAGLSADSKLLGKITGTTVLTVKAGGPVQFLAQHIFGEGSKYNGSSFTTIPGGIIPGGTGYFEGYSGYGQGVEQTVVPAEPRHVYLWDVCLSKY
ncbi:hypothetical protein M758_1G171400 [Ceratodon purpureus]|uniref:Dirigent protein n=1 Tax=Ceratodon purpureus TaxID=3225 RepID=A0A8T0J8X3_CERPU|nr:hypothetical protein KC19_1G174700 [Ceratodon purpureus]KAG0630336.1 hypothetical protein M758_1G171400 [Ceratodon purpureus]